MVDTFYTNKSRFGSGRMVAVIAISAETAIGSLV
jgi:hypothetical protein